MQNQNQNQNQKEIVNEDKESNDGMVICEIEEEDSEEGRARETTVEAEIDENGKNEFVIENIKIEVYLVNLHRL